MAETTRAKPKISITVLSDVICPYCYIGKRKLEEAVRMAGDKFDFRLNCEPYLLKPNTPPEGEPKPELPEGKPRVSAEMRELAARYGLDYTGLGERYPCTLPAHALIDWAHGFNLHWQLSEAFYKAYFTDGDFLDVPRLVGLAAGVGLDAGEADRVARDPATWEAVRAKHTHWKNTGVAGIPCFLMNGVRTYSGAKEPHELAAMFDVVAENYPQ